MRAPWGSQHESPLLERQYLEKPGVEKECIGSLCVIVTVQVKVAEFVQVPVWGNMLNHQVQQSAGRWQGQARKNN